LIISDNLSSRLSFLKGGSENFALMSLVRRSAALQIGCNIPWMLRYIERLRAIEILLMKQQSSSEEGSMVESCQEESEGTDQG